MRILKQLPIPLFFFASLASASIVVSTSGVANTVLSPSIDSLVLNASSFTTAASLFTLQTGSFTVGNSGNLAGTFVFNIPENITINGETHSLTLKAQDVVTNPLMANTDVLTIFAGAPLVFTNSGITLTTQQYVSPAEPVGGVANVVLMATESSTTTATPEPGFYILMSAGLLGLFVARSLRSKAA